MFKFNYTLDDNDYFEFNKYHVQHSPSQRRNQLLTRFGVPFICAMLVFYFHRSFDGLAFWLSVVALVAVAVGWVVGYPKLVLEPLIRRMISNLKRDGKLPFGDTELATFEMDYLRKITSTGERRVCYAALQSIVEGETAIYIYLNALEAVIMPNRIFKDEGQRQSFLKFLHTKKNS